MRNSTLKKDGLAMEEELGRGTRRRQKVLKNLHIGHDHMGIWGSRSVRKA